MHGDFIPRHIFGRFHALLANLRCAWAAFVLAVHNIFFFPRYDVVIVDQVQCASTVAPATLRRPCNEINLCFTYLYIIADEQIWWSPRQYTNN